MLNRIPALIGLSGVSPDENARARFWAGILEIPLVFVALWLMIAWYLDVTGRTTVGMHRFQDWLVWIFFVGETAFMTFLVDNKPRYLKDNWLNLFIIVAGIPIVVGNTHYAGVLRLLRMMLVFSILVHLMIPLRNLLARNHFGVTLVISSIVITFVGILAAGIDPGIKTAEDGIWWAWVTATTVGYGDVVPVTVQGRILAVVLILGGFGLFSLITANISAFLISQGEEEEIETRLDRMEITMKRIEERLERLSERDQ